MFMRDVAQWQWSGWILLLVVVLAAVFTVLPTLTPDIACLTGSEVWAHRYDKYKHCRNCEKRCRKNPFTGHETCRTVCRTRHCGTW